MPDTPARLQRLRTKGWRMPANAKYVGRPTPWGNWHKVEMVDGVGWCCTDTRSRVSTRCGSLAEAHAIAVERYRAELTAEMADRARRELRGFALCCYCRPPLACHVDVLLEVANA